MQLLSGVNDSTYIYYHKLAEETVVDELTTSLAFGVTKLMEVQFPALDHGIELCDAKD